MKLQGIDVFIESSNLEFPPHFKQWQDLVESEKERLLIICSRDHGKTTFFSVCYPLFVSALDKRHQTCIISYSEEQATKIIGKITDLINQSPFLRQLRPTNYRDSWSKHALKFSNGSTIDSLSFGSSGRGAHYDTIIVDDPVKDFSGMPPSDQIKFFRSAITPMVKPEGRMIVVGNYVYEGDLIEQLDCNPAYHVSKSPAIINDKPLWPQRWSKDRLEARRLEIGDTAFCREYLLEKISGDSQFFKKEWFKFYDIPPITKNIIALDPAISANGDYTAIVCIGTDDEGFDYLLDYANIKTDDVNKIVNKLFEMQARWNVRLAIIETIGFQKLLKHWIYDEMRKRNKHFGIEEIKSHQKSKQARILSIQPKIQSGTLLFRKEQSEIMEQLLVFPHGLHDDLIDALSMSLDYITRYPKQRPEAPDNSFDWWSEQVSQQSLDYRDNLFSDINGIVQ